MKKAIKAKKAPAATGPFSHAVVHDYSHTLEISGQVGINPESGKLLEGGMKAEMKQALENVKSILAEIGWDFSNIVKVRIYLADMKEYAVVNEVYGKYFQSDFPARVALAVKQLPLNASVEIECTAAGNKIA